MVYVYHCNPVTKYMSNDMTFNQQNECPPCFFHYLQRLRSVQSDQSVSYVLCGYFLHGDSKDSVQTELMPRLI